MLSIILSVLFFIILVAGYFYMPLIVYVYTSLHSSAVAQSWKTIMAIAYAILTTMTVADALLFWLLLRVRKSLVFTSKSVALIRAISWCALLLGVLCTVLGFYFMIAFFAAFACIFLGLCLRVVKNVIEQATEIKSENDFTI